MLIDPTNRGSKGFFNYKFKDASGRQDRSQVRKIQAHSDIVTDFAFSPLSFQLKRPIISKIVND